MQLSESSSISNSSVTVFPLLEGRVYVIYTKFAPSTGYYVMGRLWNGTHFGEEENVPESQLQDFNTYSAVADGDNIHLVFLEKTTRNLQHIRYTYGAGWGEKSLVEFQRGLESNPTLTLCPKGVESKLLVYWTYGNSIWMKRYFNNQTWEVSSPVWTIEMMSPMQGPNLVSFYQSGGRVVGVCWVEGAQVPYTLKYGFYEFKITIPHPPWGACDWHYWDANSDRAVIMLNGGHVDNQTKPSGVKELLNFYSYPGYSTQKENVIENLYTQGYSILTHRTHWPYRYGTERYVEEAATWLKGQGYQYVFIFGFSAGGAVVAYEIQKDYAATLYSAAVIASAPVNTTDEDYLPTIIFQSAQNASKVRVCTSFIVGENDVNSEMGNITQQMLDYYGNVVVHKEWHTWLDGHDVFLNMCRTHPGETVSDVTYNWYEQHPHYALNVRTKIGSSELSNVKVWIDNDAARYSPVSVNVTRGNHTVKAESSFIRGTTRYTFIYWENGAPNNPRTISVLDDMNITAFYNGTYLCPTLYVWNGTQYLEDGVLDVRSPEGIDTVVNHALINAPMLTQNQKYRLKLIESTYNLSESFIDQVRFYVIDEDGVWHESNLASATHSTNGDVIATLLYSDDIRVYVLPQQEIVLEFTKTSVSEDEIAGYVFMIEGYNPKPKPG